ncbi:VCBS repeat-containing protein [bacterium]|nr:VCBS repeat-containing protein [bacterium]
MIRVPLTLGCILLLLSAEIVQAQNFTARALGSGVQSARDVVARDFDGDGDVDLAVGAWSPGGVVFYEHQIFDTIRATEILAVGGTGRQIAAGDFDGDNDQDIVFASYGENRFYLLVNTGASQPSSRFQVTILAEGANGAFAAKAADVNGDGATDLVGTDYTSDRVRVYEQLNGQLTETWISDVGAPPLDVDISDLNGDGVKEILVAVGGLGQEGGIYRLTRTQNGSYSVTQEITDHYVTSVRVTDLDNDGNLDIVAAEFAEQHVLRFERSGNNWVQTTLPGSQSHPYDLVIEDFDEDGLLDVACAAQGANNSGGGVFWWRQTASGTFTVQTLSSDPEFYGLESVDFDLDGDADLIATNNEGSEVILFRNNMGVPSWILGSVSSERGNLPISGVRVLAEESGAFTLSGANGQYALGVSSGTYTLRFDHPCWDTTRVYDVAVAFEDTAYADAEMRGAQLELGITSLNVFVPWGETSTFLIPIENPGDAVLQVSGAANSTAPDNEWIVLIEPELTILPGESEDMSVEITADVNNGLLPEYLGEIVLQTNACPDTLLNIAVVAVVLDAPERPESLPSTTELLAAYPNPFNAQVNIPLEVARNETVHLVAFDVTGRLVEMIFSGEVSAGRHDLTWNAAEHASGNYIISLRTEDGVHSARTVTLIK